MADDKRPKFFQEVHRLAQPHDVVAYVVVGVVRVDDKLTIATGAGSRMRDDHEATAGVYASMAAAFATALGTLTEPDPDLVPPKGGLLN